MICLKTFIRKKIYVHKGILFAAMVDVSANVLELLVCSTCKQLLRKGPVFQQHDGAAVCGLCQAREDAQPASRCLLYEATAQLLRFPCRYQEDGCPATV